MKQKIELSVLIKLILIPLWGIFLVHLLGSFLFGPGMSQTVLINWLILLSISSFVCVGLLQKHIKQQESSVEEHVLKEYSDSFRNEKSGSLLRRRMTNEDLALQVLKTQSELHSLQQQISPHFLYNTLESIRAQALREDADDIAEMIELLARFFRYSISRQNDYATILDEVDNVSTYIRIQNRRFGDKFRFVLHLEEIESLQDSFYMPIMCLQPIVENAIHHGLERKAGTGTIVLRAFTTENCLIMQIEDDGVGMNESTVSTIRDLLHGNSQQISGTDKRLRGNGIALVNTHQRMMLFFGPEYGINVSSVLGGGTLVELVMPKISPKPESKKES